MYRGYNQQVEHVSSCANKKINKNLQGDWTPILYRTLPTTKYLFAKKTQQHSHIQESTPTPQNKRSRNQKPLPTCWSPKTNL